MADKNSTPSQEIAVFRPVDPLITVVLKDEAQEMLSRAGNLSNQRIAGLCRLMEQPRRPCPMPRTDLWIKRTGAQQSPQSDGGPCCPSSS
ncbi:hypothetical protein [Streptomyces sp. CS014]|uniref:hypothetical protein n=1 Tax=Streptomyces sp. CS014 TaxID=2162707 RepID=UPI0013A5B7BB|nr:hypothetical protein [Streptomyces sp. CS014]